MVGYNQVTKTLGLLTDLIDCEFHMLKRVRVGILFFDVNQIGKGDISRVAWACSGRNTMYCWSLLVSPLNTNNGIEKDGTIIILTRRAYGHRAGPSHFGALGKTCFCVCGARPYFFLFKYFCQKVDPFKKFAAKEQRSMSLHKAPITNLLVLDMHNGWSYNFYTFHDLAYTKPGSGAPERLAP